MTSCCYHLTSAQYLKTVLPLYMYPLQKQTKGQDVDTSRKDISKLFGADLSKALSCDKLRDKSGF